MTLTFDRFFFSSEKIDDSLSSSPKSLRIVKKLAVSRKNQEKLQEKKKHKEHKRSFTLKVQRPERNPAKLALHFVYSF